MAGLPVTVDLEGYRGDTWSQTFRLKHGDTPVDLTGAEVASWADGGGGLRVELVCTTDPTAGEVTISAEPGMLEALRYTYDLEVTAGGEVRTWVRGKLVVRADITNEAMV